MKLTSDAKYGFWCILGAPTAICWLQVTYHHRMCSYLIFKYFKSHNDNFFLCTCLTSQDLWFLAELSFQYFQ